MLPSRYMVIDEKRSYPVKRRVRGRGDDRGGEPAITLLPPEPYLMMEKPDLRLPLPPTVYRTTAPKSAKNKEASSFVILGETMRTPVQSRPGSPSGRVSPFRGRGFKSPATSRANSRAPSPSDSPRKSLKLVKTGKTLDRPRVGRDIGLPPKSPMKSKPSNLETKPAERVAAGPEKAEAKNGDVEAEAKAEAEAEGEAGESRTEVEAAEGKAKVDAEIAVGSGETETATKDGGCDISGVEGKKPEQLAGQASRDPPPAAKTKAALMPVTPREKKSPLSPTPKSKTKSEKNQANTQQSVIKKANKPPVAPKKIGLKTSLKAEENVKDQEGKKSKKEGARVRNDASDEREEHKVGSKGKDDVSRERGRQTEGTKGKAGSGEREKKKEVHTAEPAAPVEKDAGSGVVPGEAPKEGAGVEEPKAGAVEKPRVGDVRGAEEKGGGGEKPGAAAEKGEKSEKKSEKLIPCFQPDKCQIAPPTMASPSPIMTPTISTPSLTSDLASSSTKNSQSIATAPTMVTPSSLGSVSSTVVLTGNLARREIQSRSKPKEADADNSAASVALGKEAELSGPPEKVANTQMVKAGSKDSVEWSKKDSLSGEMTSTKVIRAEPDVEVLSPNNLRESPPRMPRPPNLAWDEGRLANGDVPNKAESEGRFRRAIAAVWRFLSYVFCWRCCSCWKCWRSSGEEGMVKPSLLSRLNWCKSCRNPFKCCTCGCRAKCCEGRRCCRRKEKLGKPKPKPKPKPRKCCAKADCSCKGCCDKLKNLCLCSRDKLNSICRSLFCLNMLCCQKFLRKFKCCHKFKCCQKSGFCSCCNPNVKREAKKLNKKGSRTSNNSRDKDNLDAVLVEHTSLMKAAIPVLPSCLAVFCLILNLFVPGFGTLVSGILCLCFGKPRFSVKDSPKSRMGSFVLNTIIGVAQLFTVVFCLVGWGWSIWWGVIMYKLSRRQKRLKLAEKNQKEAEGSNVNHNHVDVEQG